MHIFNSESAWNQVSCELAQVPSSQWLTGLIATSPYTASWQLHGYLSISFHPNALNLSVCAHSSICKYKFLSVVCRVHPDLIPHTWVTTSTLLPSISLYGLLDNTRDLSSAKGHFTFHSVPIKLHSTSSFWYQWIWLHLIKYLKQSCFFWKPTLTLFSS